VVGYGPPPELEGNVRRSGTVSRKTGKPRRRKITKAKPGSSPIPASGRHSSGVNLQEQLKRQACELEEAREERATIAEVLRVISSSPGELEPVFQTILQNATRLCEAKFGVLFEFADGAFRALSNLNTPPALVDFNTKPRVWGPHTGLGRLAHTRQTVHVEDALADRAYAERDAARKAAVELGGVRTFLAVPMLKEDVLVGAITIHRQEVRPFTDRQIALVTNFAAQAVIAIENTRLLSELREALENQTTSADVLRAIASSPATAERALDVIAETTARRFGASNVNIRVLEGNVLRYIGSTGPTAAHMQTLFPEGPIDANASSGQAILERRQIYLRADSEHPGLPMPSRAAGIVSSVATPLIREGQAIGVLMVLRSDPRPFTDTDLAQLSNFASQAVIAIENTRLLNELRETLERQTATADILRVIASTPEDSKRALDTIAETAARMFNAANVNFRRIEGNVLHVIGAAGPTAAKVREVLPDFPLDAMDPAVRSVIDNRQIHIENRRAVLPNERGEIARVLRDLPLGSQAFTPLSRQGEAIGVMIVTRSEV
jgi:GAF domain-containing protein